VEDALYGRDEERQATEMKRMLQTKGKNRNKIRKGRTNVKNCKTKKNCERVKIKQSKICTENKTE
jgi:hypothetical protein